MVGQDLDHSRHSLEEEPELKHGHRNEHKMSVE